MHVPPCTVIHMQAIQFICFQQHKVSELSWGKPGVSSALRLSSALSCVLSTSSHYHCSPVSTHIASKLGQMLSCFSAGLFSSLHGIASTGLEKQGGFSQSSQISRIKTLAYSFST